MGYSLSKSLWRCHGESCKYFPMVQGQKMGWGFVAFGFGLSFGVVIFMFGFISSHINPATCLALWVMGKISG